MIISQTKDVSIQPLTPSLKIKWKISAKIAISLKSFQRWPRYVVKTFMIRSYTYIKLIHKLKVFKNTPVKFAKGNSNYEFYGTLQFYTNVWYSLISLLRAKVHLYYFGGYILVEVSLYIINQQHCRITSMLSKSFFFWHLYLSWRIEQSDTHASSGYSWVNKFCLLRPSMLDLHSKEAIYTVHKKLSTIRTCRVILLFKLNRDFY